MPLCRRCRCVRVSTCHCAVGAVVCECLRATVPWVPSCASVCVPLCRCARVSACHCRFGCLNSLVLFGATRVYPAAFRGADLLARPLARTSTWMFPLRFAINIFALRFSCFHLPSIAKGGQQNARSTLHDAAHGTEGAHSSIRRHSMYVYYRRTCKKKAVSEGGDKRYRYSD